MRTTTFLPSADLAAPVTIVGPPATVESAETGVKSPTFASAGRPGRWTLGTSAVAGLYMAAPGWPSTTAKMIGVSSPSSTKPLAS